jgi:hypothetical protein
VTAVPSLRDARQLLRDLVDFARAEKVWWVVPLVVVLLLAAGMVAASQAAAPFLYAFF